MTIREVHIPNVRYPDIDHARAAANGVLEEIREFDAYNQMDDSAGDVRTRRRMLVEKFKSIVAAWPALRNEEEMKLKTRK